MGNAKVSTTVWAVADFLPCTTGSFVICTNIDRGKNISDGKLLQMVTSLCHAHISASIVFVKLGII